MSVHADKQTRVRIGSLGEFPVGERRILELGDTRIGVFNVDGALYALRDVCPHQLSRICTFGKLGETMIPSPPSTYQLGLDGHVLRCARHGWEFDVRTGLPVFGIDHRRVGAYLVEIDGDDVYVDLTKRPTG